jgi:hypothetical protein
MPWLVQSCGLTQGCGLDRHGEFPQIGTTDRPHQDGSGGKTHRVQNSQVPLLWSWPCGPQCDDTALLLAAPGARAYGWLLNKNGHQERAVGSFY